MATKFKRLVVVALAALLLAGGAAGGLASQAAAGKAGTTYHQTGNTEEGIRGLGNEQHHRDALASSTNAPWTNGDY